jgi:hypothetical protein
VNDIEDLIGEFAGIYVRAVGVVRNVGYVEGADVWDVGEALEEVVLSSVSPFSLSNKRRNNATYPVLVVNRHGQLS